MKTKGFLSIVGRVAVVLALGCCFLSSPFARSSDFAQWRGADRNGLSPEKGLLREWPKGGPKLTWKITDLGRGYAAPAVVGDRVYLLANEGLDNEHVTALQAQDGTKLWSARLGRVGNPEQKPNFPAARSTPTIEGNRLYALGSDGDLVCLETAKGDVVWRKNLRTDFGGKPGTWAYSESPLIDGDKVICTPGGSEATLVALNKTTGETVWKCALPEGDEAAYASPIILEQAGIRQCVQLLQKGLAGVEADSGKLLWRYDRAVSRFNANIPSPLASEDSLYVASAGTGGGVIRLNVQDGRVQPEELYFGPKYPTAIGGAVKVGDFLYGTTGQAMLCVEFKTGEIKWEERALGAASMVYADGRLILHAESGEVALVEPSPEGYREKGRFTPPNPPEKAGQMEKAWAYPVVANGRLYLRDHEVLWCYAMR